MDLGRLRRHLAAPGMLQRRGDLGNAEPGCRYWIGCLGQQLQRLVGTQIIKRLQRGRIELPQQNPQPLGVPVRSQIRLLWPRATILIAPACSESPATLRNRCPRCAPSRPTHEHRRRRSSRRRCDGSPITRHLQRINRMPDTPTPAAPAPTDPAQSQSHRRLQINSIVAGVRSNHRVQQSIPATSGNRALANTRPASSCTSMSW